MIIAVSYKDNEIFEHFGHAEMFAVYKTNDDNTEIISKELVEVKDLSSFHNTLLNLSLINLTDLKTESHVIENCHVWVQSVVLEYHCDITVLRLN